MLRIKELINLSVLTWLEIYGDIDGALISVENVCSLAFSLTKLQRFRQPAMSGLRQHLQDTGEI